MVEVKEGLDLLHPVDEDHQDLDGVRVNHYHVLLACVKDSSFYYVKEFPCLVKINAGEE